ncbi:unnamed protein product, partial [Symbiodinium microadriaticum]
ENSSAKCCQHQKGLPPVVRGKEQGAEAQCLLLLAARARHLVEAPRTLWQA